MNFLRRFFHRPPLTLSSLNAYAKWAASYAAHAHNPLMEIEQEAMLQQFPDVQGKIVLDLACGTGRYGLLARQRGAKQVFGLDNSPTMLQAAQVQQVALATTEALPLPAAAVDVVTCGLALGHLPQIEPTLREVYRVLQPGGIALISDFHPFQSLSGARRTFQAANGKVYAVEHYLHLVADYFAAGQAAGLSLTAIVEPAYDRKPVVLVLRYEKRPKSDHTGSR